MTTARTALFVAGIACAALLVGEQAVAAPTIYVSPPQTYVEIGDSRGSRATTCGSTMMRP